MGKPTAVIDKTLFHEICQDPCQRKREFYWSCLHERYQVVVPFILIEEVLVNMVRPGGIEEPVLKRMGEQLIILRSCWIDDVFEYAFRELVQRQPLGKFVAPPDGLQQALLALARDDPKLVKWVEDRKLLRKATAAKWKAEQRRLAPSSGFVMVKSEQEFFERAVKREFLSALVDPQKKWDMLETIIGKTFRHSHPESTKQIDEAFAEYTEATFSTFPFTLNCLTTRLTYVLAPAVRIQTARDTEPQIILRPKRRDQDNNWADEQYVVSALVCDRLLTMDAGMRNVANIFHVSRLWNGQTIFIEPGEDLAGQIPRLLV